MPHGQIRQTLFQPTLSRSFLLPLFYPLSSQICNMQEGKLRQRGHRTPVAVKQTRNHSLGFVSAIWCTLKSSWKVNGVNLAPASSSVPSDPLLRDVFWLESVYSNPYCPEVHHIFWSLKGKDVSRVHLFRTRPSFDLRDGKGEKHMNIV